MSDQPDPNVQTQPGNGQTDDYKTQFLELSAKIANGEYVPKNVYTGLQTKHEKEVLAHKADVDALQAANQKVAEFESTLKTLQGQSEEFKTKYEGAVSELTTTKAKAERLGFIMEKFPHLVTFEGKGLLPPASSLDELTQKLTAFSETVGVIQQQKKEDHLAGTTNPPSPGTTPEPTASKLLEEARALQRAGKFAEYNQKMDAYYKLQPSA